MHKVLTDMDVSTQGQSIRKHNFSHKLLTLIYSLLCQTPAQKFLVEVEGSGGDGKEEVGKRIRNT